jgi:hypothetical protein
MGKTRTSLSITGDEFQAGPSVLADEVSISLLLVGEGLEVLLDLKPDDGGGLVGQIVGELLGVHGG